MSVCVFFGHRDCDDDVKPLLLKTIETLILDHDVRQFYVGNHGRFDSMALQILRKMREKYPEIEYSVVLTRIPTKTAQGDYDAYETSVPEGVEQVPPRFAISFCNHWMLQRATHVIAYVTRSYGGASQFVKKAYKMNKTVINIA